jgi:hypothetical protein
MQSVGYMSRLTLIENLFDTIVFDLVQATEFQKRLTSLLRPEESQSVAPLRFASHLAIDGDLAEQCLGPYQDNL